jgi:hypothetical protein
MTELLEHAIERVRSLPPEAHDNFARVFLRRAGEDATVYQLTPEKETDLDAAEAEVERGELATDAEVAAVFAKYRL